MADRGKLFEAELTSAFRRWHRTPFVLRIKDGAQSKGATTKNPADILASGRDLNFLIEAKATGPVSGKQNPNAFPCKRLKGHQRGALMQYSDIKGGQHVGVLALLFYNGKRGNDRIHRAFFVEARSYYMIVKRMRRGFHPTIRKRKSISIEMLEQGDIPALELEWEPGVGWDLEASFGGRLRGPYDIFVVLRQSLGARGREDAEAA